MRGKGGLDIAARAVVCIASAGHERIQGERDVGGRAAERTDLVKRRSERHHTVTRHGSVCGLHTDHTAKRRRLANRTAGIRSQGKCCHARGDRRGRTSGGAAGNALEVPWVVRTVKRRALRGGTERELVHIGLAERHATRVEHALDARGGIGRLVVLQHTGGAGGTRAQHVHVVLDGQWHAGQRRQGLAGGAKRVHTGGGAKSHLRRDLEKCLDIRLTRIDGGQRRAGHLDGAELSRSHTRGDIHSGEGIDECRH